MDEPVKIYTPTTELEKIQAANLSYIFKEAVQYRKLSTQQEVQIAALQTALRQVSPFIQLYIVMSTNPILANQAAALLPEIERLVEEG
jgi:hypothetical protein